MKKSSLYPPLNVVNGDGCGVEIPDSNMYMHTHPEFCYKSYNYNAGWPSPADIFLDIKRALMFRDTISLVLSLEGYYIQKIFFKTFVKYTLDERLNFIFFLLLYFSTSEFFRRVGEFDEFFIYKLLTELNYMSYVRMVEMFQMFVLNVYGNNDSSVKDRFNCQDVIKSVYFQEFLDAKLEETPGDDSKKHKAVRESIFFKYLNNPNEKLLPEKKEDYKSYLWEPIITINLLNSFVVNSGTEKDSFFIPIETGPGH